MANKFLYRFNRRPIIRHGDGESATFQTCAAGPANTMNVVFNGESHTKVDDDVDIANVQPARRHVRRDENRRFARAESVEYRRSLSLRLITAQRLSGDAPSR